MVTSSPTDPSIEIYFEVHGDGAPLLLGFPMMASQAEVFGDFGAATLAGYLDGLTDRYRVLLVDYPSIGRSGTIPPDDFDVDRVCSDLMAVADAAGFDEFAYWGYSWGGGVGLQLAWRTDRLSALVIGGWPPLGAPYDKVLEGARLQVDDPPESAKVVLRGPGQYRQWVTYLGSVGDWPEAEAVARIDCPRMVFTASDGNSDAGGIVLPIATTILSRRGELESMGWVVRVIPDRDFGVCMDPAAVVPVMRQFLDEVV